MVHVHRPWATRFLEISCSSIIITNLTFMTRSRTSNLQELCCLSTLAKQPKYTTNYVLFQWIIPTPLNTQLITYCSSESFPPLSMPNCHLYVLSLPPCIVSHSMWFVSLPFSSWTHPCYVLHKFNQLFSLPHPHTQGLRHEFEDGGHQCIGRGGGQYSKNTQIWRKKVGACMTPQLLWLRRPCTDHLLRLACST